MESYTNTDAQRVQPAPHNAHAYKWCVCFILWNGWIEATEGSLLCSDLFRADRKERGKRVVCASCDCLRHHHPRHFHARAFGSARVCFISFIESETQWLCIYEVHKQGRNVHMLLSLYLQIVNTPIHSTNIAKKTRVRQILTINDVLKGLKGVRDICIYMYVCGVHRMKWHNSLSTIVVCVCRATYTWDMKNWLFYCTDVCEYICFMYARRTTKCVVARAPNANQLLLFFGRASDVNYVNDVIRFSDNITIIGKIASFAFITASNTATHKQPED